MLTSQAQRSIFNDDLLRKIGLFDGGIQGRGRVTPAIWPPRFGALSHRCRDWLGIGDSRVQRYSWARAVVISDELNESVRLETLIDVPLSNGGPEDT